MTVTRIVTGISAILVTVGTLEIFDDNKNGASYENGTSKA